MYSSGSDGSRKVTMTIDATGTGKSFVAGKVSKNGQAVRICSSSIVHSSTIVFVQVAFIVRFGGYNRVFGFGDHVHRGQKWKPVSRCMLFLPQHFYAGVLTCGQSFMTSAGFGNCVVVQQGNGTTQASTTTPISSPTSSSETATNVTSTTAGGAATSCSVRISQSVRVIWIENF
jgi:hypothetical protein